MASKVLVKIPTVPFTQVRIPNIFFIDKKFIEISADSKRTSLPKFS